VTLVECWKPQDTPARHEARVIAALTELFM
jgi:hypothetical protein